MTTIVSLASRRLVAAIALLTSAACASIPLGRSGGDELPAMSRKTVARKHEPNELIAADYTRCTVGTDKFERTKVGDHTWCMWR